MMSGKVLIAHVPYQIRGGEDVHVEILAEAYRRIGLEPVFFPQNREPGVPRFSDAWASLQGARSASIAELWAREKPRYIHLHNAFPDLGPAFFRWVLAEKVPLVMTVHNHRFFCTNGLALRGGQVCKDCFRSRVAWRPLIYGCNGNAKKTAYHAAAMTEMRLGQLYERAVSRFIAPSPYIRDELVRFGIPQDRVTLLMNPVMDVPGDLQPLAKRYDLLYAGRLSPEKGIRELLAAIRLLPDLEFAIVGDGPERSLVEAAARENPRIHYLGSVPSSRVRQLIASSRVGVLPSICNEILPTFVLECFSQGKRCVISDQESVRWLAEKNMLGILAPVRDSVAFSRVLRNAIAMGSLPTSANHDLAKKLNFDRFCEELDRSVASSRGGK